MATIVTKNSSTASAVPTTSDLVQGELAVNVTDKRIFTENASTQIVELGTNPSSITTATATVTGTLTANGTFASSNAVITGGSINSTPIGATTPSTIVGSTVTANTGFVGGLTGNVTGNLTGNVTGNVTGNLTGNVTGNVTASSGTTTLNDLVVNGTADFTNTKLTNITTPTADSDAANKSYVDDTVAAVIDSAPAALDTLNELAAALGDDANFAGTVTTALATKLPLAGGTMTGAIAMGTSKITGLGDPTSAQDAATKTYVDTADALKLNLTGGTMSGAIAMGTNKITGVGDPTLAQDVATKAYTDSILGSATSAAASAAAAATSESNAATSASNAATSETNALNSANAAASSYDQFDDRYLGDKASDPTLDNDGNALLTGALYFNTTTDVMRVYTGSAWQDTAISPNSPTFTGTVTADGLTVNGDITQSDNNPLYTISDTDGGASQLDFGGGSVVINADKDSEYTNRVIQLQVQGVKGFQLLDGGDISFYEDTGTTPKFFWDASAESLGIGTTSLTTTDGSNIELSAATNSRVILGSTGTGGRKWGMGTGTEGTLNFYDYTASANRLLIDTNGNIGIGTSSPVESLTVGATPTTAGFSLGNSTTQTFLRYNNYFSGTSQVSDATKGSASMSLGRSSDGVITFNTAAAGAGTPAERLRITSSGNVGIGVVPSAWNSQYKALQIGSSSALWSIGSGAGGSYLTNNVLFDASFGRKYIVTGNATEYAQLNGQHQWYTASSGTAGNAITFTQAMTLDASGSLLAGRTSQISGDGAKLVLQQSNAPSLACYKPGTSNVDLARFYSDTGGYGLKAKIAGDGGAYFNGTVNANAFVGDGSGLTGVGGGGAWELLSTTTLSGTARTVDITWEGITLSDYSAIVIKIEGLKNSRDEVSNSLEGQTMYGATPTALTGSFSYISSGGFLRTTSNTYYSAGILFPSLYTGSWNSFLYIHNPSSTSIYKKSISMILDPMDQGSTQSYQSASAHATDTNTITGFRFIQSGGSVGFDYLVGSFKVYGVKA